MSRHDTHFSQPVGRRNDGRYSGRLPCSLRDTQLGFNLIVDKLRRRRPCKDGCHQSRSDHDDEKRAKDSTHHTDCLTAPTGLTFFHALDALFFWLYGLGEDDAEYVMETFPIVREQDEREFGRYRTRDDVLELLRLFG